MTDKGKQVCRRCGGQLKKVRKHKFFKTDRLLRCKSCKELTQDYINS